MPLRADERAACGSVAAEPTPLLLRPEEHAGPIAAQQRAFGVRMRDTRAVDLPRCHSDRRGWAECEAAGRADATAGGTSPAPSCAAAEVRVSGMQGKALRQQRLAQNSRPGQAVCTTRSDRFRAVPCGTGRGQCRVRAARTARASVPAVHTRAREREPWRPGRSTPRRPRTARHGSHYSSRHAPSRPAPTAPTRRPRRCAKGDAALTSAARGRPGMRVAIGRRPPRFAACRAAGSENSASAVKQRAPGGEYREEPSSRPAGRARRRAAARPRSEKRSILMRALMT